MASDFLHMPTSVVLATILLAAQGGLAAMPASLGVRLESNLAECPTSVEVESALRQILGDGEWSPSGWVLSYGRDAASTQPGRAATLRMTFVDPGGERLAERQIPATPEDCHAIASAMAAVVERSLRTLGWTRGAALPESARPLPARETSKPAARRAPPRVLLGAGPSIGSSTRTGTNLLVEARIRATGLLVLRLAGGVLSTGDSQRVGSGTASETSRFFTVAPLLAFAFKRVELAGGPSLLLGFDSGSYTRLAQVGNGNRETLAVGAALAIALQLSTRWRLSASLQGYHAALGGDYVVMVNERRTVVLSPSAWEGIASAQVEFVAWP